MKTLLLTGSTGFLGYRTIEYLLETTDYNIVGAARTRREHREFDDPRVNYLFGDLSDDAYVESLFNQSIDVVVNCASLSSPWGKRSLFVKANITTQELLIKHSKKNNVELFVYISTPSKYVNFKDRIGLTEESIVYKPINHYADTKLIAENMIKDSGLNYITLRPRALVGRGDSIIFPRLLNAHKEGKLRLMGSGKNLCDLTSVKNMAHAIKCAIDSKKGTQNTSYNISDGESIVLWDIINQVLERLNHPPVTKTISRRNAMILASILEFFGRISISQKEPPILRYSVSVLTNSMTLDISKARNLLGYEPLMTTQEGIDEFVNDVLKNKAKSE